MLQKPSNLTKGVWREDVNVKKSIQLAHDLFATRDPSLCGCECVLSLLQFNPEQTEATRIELFGKEGNIRNNFHIFFIQLSSNPRFGCGGMVCVACLETQRLDNMLPRKERFCVAGGEIWLYGSHDLLP